jgi:hypothetical protein
MKERGKLTRVEQEAKSRYLASIELRPTPPAVFQLNDDQKVIWKLIVDGQPPGWFTSAQFPLLAQLCRLIDQANTVGKWADEAKAAGKERTYNRWSRSTNTLTRVIQSTANKMRLNISSALKAKPIKKRIEAQLGKVGKAKPKHTPWGEDDETQMVETDGGDQVPSPEASSEPVLDRGSSRAAPKPGRAEDDDGDQSSSAPDLDDDDDDEEHHTNGNMNGAGSAPARPWD